MEVLGVVQRGPGVGGSADNSDLLGIPAAAGRETAEDVFIEVRHARDWLIPKTHAKVQTGGRRSDTG